MLDNPLKEEQSCPKRPQHQIGETTLKRAQDCLALMGRRAQLRNTREGVDKSHQLSGTYQRKTVVQLH